ncbi:MAG: hypothetical protein ABWZ29_04935 [Casimicrobiaceae bacterium]
MSRAMLFLVLLLVALGMSDVSAQAKKGSAPARNPTAKDPSILVNVYMRDAGKNEVLVATRIFPGFPEYNAVALARYFAVMKALEPAYVQDDDVAYTWGTKGKVTKCSIYLESWEANAKGGTGAVAGCEANGVSNVAVTASADPKKAVSLSSDPAHMKDTLELFKKQMDRARQNIAKG